MKTIFLPCAVCFMSKQPPAMLYSPQSESAVVACTVLCYTILCHRIFRSIMGESIALSICCTCFVYSPTECAYKAARRDRSEATWQ